MIFRKEQICFVEEAFENKEEVLKYLAKMFYMYNLINSAEEFERALIEREAISNTGFQDGFAIPQVTSPTVKELSCVYLKLAKPVEWGSREGKPVDKIFCLGIPTTGISEDFAIIPRVASSLINEEFRGALINAKDVESIYNQLIKI